MLTVRRWLLAMVPVVALCTTLAMSTGTASASVNVLAAIRQQNLKIGASGAIERLRHLEETDRHQPGKLAAAFDKLAGQCAHAATVVSHSSADSRRQAEGRHDWVVAFRALSTGLYKLGHAERVIRAGNQRLGDQLLLTAERKLRTAEVLGGRSNRLLGVRAF